MNRGRHKKKPKIRTAESIIADVTSFINSFDWRTFKSTHNWHELYRVVVIVATANAIDNTSINYTVSNWWFNNNFYYYDTLKRLEIILQQSRYYEDVIIRKGGVPTLTYKIRSNVRIKVNIYKGRDEEKLIETKIL